MNSIAACAYSTVSVPLKRLFSSGLKALLLAGLLGAGAAQAISCFGKSGAAACGGPSLGTCISTDTCVCQAIASGTECGTPTYCGTASCSITAASGPIMASTPNRCLAPAGLCTQPGASGQCFCGPGRSGTCCEIVQTGGQLAPAGLDFGNVVVGASAPAQTVFTFSNPSPVPLTLASITLAGANSADFSIQGGGCSAGTPLAAAGTCSINLAFTPGAAGTRGASIGVATGLVEVPQGGVDSLFNNQFNVPLSSVIESNAVPINQFSAIGSLGLITNGVLLVETGGVWSSVGNSFTTTTGDTRLAKVQQTSSASYATPVVTQMKLWIGNDDKDYYYFTSTTLPDPSLVTSASLTGNGTSANASSATSSIVIDPAAPATLYAGIEGAGVYKSTNSGGNWTAAATQPGNLQVKALVIKPGDGTRLFAATYGGGVFRSSDSGVNWNVLCASQPANLNLLSLVMNASGKLFAGSEAGVFVSTDGCASWTAMNSGLPL